METTDLDRKLAKAARECSREAVRSTLAAGRPVAYLDGDRLIRRWPDGHEELVEVLPQK